MNIVTSKEIIFGFFQDSMIHSPIFFKKARLYLQSTLDSRASTKMPQKRVLRV